LAGIKNRTIGECAGCRKPLTKGASHRYQGKNWCEDCAMEARHTRRRKTHWQYLKSIRTDYLQLSRPTAPEKNQETKRSEQGED